MPCRIRSTCVFLIGFLIALASGAAPALAQDDSDFEASDPEASEPDTSFVGRLARSLGHESIDVGLILQLRGEVWFEPGDEGTTGLEATGARILFRGALHGGFSYAVNSDLTKSPILVEARIRYAPSSAFVLSIGMYKSPFSAEALRSSRRLDFVDRSRATQALAPGRQVGLGVDGTLLDTPAGTKVTYAAGLYNGDGRSLSANRDNTFLYVGRLEAELPAGAGLLTVAANATYENNGSSSRFPRTANQFFAGADVRYEGPDWFVSGEYVRGVLDERFLPNRHPYGYHATVGYTPEDASYELMVRLDTFDPDFSAEASAADDISPLVLLGLRLDFTAAASLLVNHVIPTRDPAFDRQHLRMLMQITF